MCPVVRTEESSDELRDEFPSVIAADAVGAEFWNGLEGNWHGLVWALAPSQLGGEEEFENMHRQGATRAARWAGGRLIPMVYISSTSVYAEGAGGWVDESSAVAEKDPRAMAMVEAEQETILVGGSVLRCAGIYGPGREIRPDVGGPERWLNVIHVEDAARAVGVALGVPRQIFNVCEDDALTRGTPGGVWAQASVRSRRSKRVRNRKLKETGWTASHRAT